MKVPRAKAASALRLRDWVSARWRARPTAARN